MVVPTVRPDSLTDFIQEWTPLFEKHDVDLIVVQDKKPWKVRSTRARTFSHDDVPDFIPRGTDMIRSWGIYKAWQSRRPYTLTLDDDVRPVYSMARSVTAYPGGHQVVDIFEEYERVFEAPASLSPYLSVGALTSGDLEMRGFPYADRANATVDIQYGGWQGVLDYDAATQIAQPRGFQTFGDVVVPVPKGTPVTTCIMNAAWRTAAAPIMWQLPMLGGLYNRFGDIWSGLLQKKTLDLYGRVMVVNGRAKVNHQRASNPVTNLVREAPGVGINETLWAWLGEGAQPEVPLVGDRLTTGWRHFVDRFAEHPDLDPAYATHLREAVESWTALFS